MAFTTTDRVPQRDLPTVRGTRDRARLIALGVVLGLGLAIALFLYEPWRRTPFDILDFSEFLPLLQRNGTFASRLDAFVRYYASQGRFNVLSYCFLIWKWSLFGNNEAAWQLARFVQMVGITFGVFALLRRLGAERPGAIAGATLFVVANGAAPAWIRLTMGEPLGLMAILGAALLATEYQRTPRWRATALAIAGLLTCALLAKEMLAAFVPFVLLLACTGHAQGRYGRPEMSRRNLWLVGLTVGSAVAALIPVAFVALQAASDKYAAVYGTSPSWSGRFIAYFLTFLLPVQARYAPYLDPWILPGNALFLAIVVVGWWLGLRADAERRHRLAVGGAALALIAVGAMLYAPWPYFNSFYGLPFLLGSALLLAFGITFIERHSANWRWLAYAACLALFTHAAMFAGYTSRSAIARRNVNRALVDDFVQHASADSIVIAMRYVPAQRWVGIAATLQRYAAAVRPDAPIPAINDTLCSAAVPLFRQGGGNALLVTYTDQCGALPEPGRTVRVYYPYVYWPTLSIRTDSVRADILGPRSPQ